MQREIKFRAWDKFRRKMCSHEDIKIWDRFMEDDMSNQYAPLMQYTGLKDKNGKEIYEGDLIEVKTDKVHFISEIEWNETIGGFEFQDTENTWCGLDAIHTFKNGQSLFGGFVEVIGNIYENPELLEVSE